MAKCPKCKGDLITMKGTLYCPKCDEYVQEELESDEEKLKELMRKIFGWEIE